MAKFCGKCGAKLDEATGLCPNCDADKKIKEVSAQDQPSEPLRPVQDDNKVPEDSLNIKGSKNATKKRKKAKRTARQKLRSFFIKAVAFLLLLLLLLIGGIGGLSYYGVIQAPTITTFMEKLGLNHESDIVNLCKKFCKDYDMLSDNNDGTYIVEIVAPDFASILMQEMQNNHEETLDAETLNTWINQHPDLKKVYEVTAKSENLDDIQQAFFQQISYDLMVSAIMETYIVESQVQEAAE